MQFVQEGENVEVRQLFELPVNPLLLKEVCDFEYEFLEALDVRLFADERQTLQMGCRCHIR